MNLFDFRGHMHIVCSERHFRMFNSYFLKKTVSAQDSDGGGGEEGEENKSGNSK